MRVPLPSGLSGLLGKLGMATQPKGGEGVAKKGLEGQQPGGLQKGQAIGDGKVLAGLGFNGADKTGSRKNVAEKENVARFLKDPGEEIEKLRGAKGEKAEAKEADKAAAEAARDRGDAKEAQREGVRKDERADDVRAQAREVQERREAKETPEAREPEKERQRERDQQDEREKHGQAWAHEDGEDDDPDRPKHGALHEDDALGDSVRCRGTIEDGSRCLRKPVTGTPYCREHFLP